VAVGRRKEAGAWGHLVAMGSRRKQKEGVGSLLLLRLGEIDGLLVVLVISLPAFGYVQIVPDPADADAQMANGMVGNMPALLGYHSKQAFCC
jgi:hypothetical protein